MHNRVQLWFSDFKNVHVLLPISATFVLTDSVKMLHVKQTVTELVLKRLFHCKLLKEFKKDFPHIDQTLTLKCFKFQRAPSELSAHQKKILPIDTHVGISIAGLTADARQLR